MLFWGAGKHKESLVPGCVRNDSSKVQEAISALQSLVPGCIRSDASKVQEAISALLNRDEVLLKGQAEIERQLLEKDVRKQETIQQSNRN